MAGSRRARCSSSCIRQDSACESSLVTGMAGQDEEEGGVLAREPDGEGVAGEPDDQTGEPQAQAKTDRGGERAVEDGEAAWGSSQQDGLGQGTVEGHLEAGNGRRLSKHGITPHSISAPPANEKNDRKNEVAAKAMERPNTIWMSRRRPPPMSPKARLNPVTMMMTTAMTLVTGPSIDSRMRCSGASQGMPDPAACAVAAPITRKARLSTPAMEKRGRRGGEGLSHIGLDLLSYGM